MQQEVEQWIQDHGELSILINSIRRESSNDREAALLAYHKIAEILQLPKNMTDISDADSENEYDDDTHDEPVSDPRSLFEVLAFINYMEPDENILDKVLLALYIVHNKRHIDEVQAALKHYGSKKSIPTPFFVFFFGKDIDARISFDNPGGSYAWTDSGAVAMMQFGL